MVPAAAMETPPEIIQAPTVHTATNPPGGNARVITTVVSASDVSGKLVTPQCIIKSPALMETPPEISTTPTVDTATNPPSTDARATPMVVSTMAASGAENDLFHYSF